MPVPSRPCRMLSRSPGRRTAGPGLLLAALLALAACDTPAERAEAHYQRALALLADGDTARADLEFRNVFRLDAGHAAARLAYARMLRRKRRDRRGDQPAAAPRRSGPAGISRASARWRRSRIEAGDFDTGAVATAEAFALAPADPAVRALKATIDFRKGGADRDGRGGDGGGRRRRGPRLGAGADGARRRPAGRRRAGRGAGGRSTRASPSRPATRGCISPASRRSTCSATPPAPAPSSPG